MHKALILFHVAALLSGFGFATQQQPLLNKVANGCSVDHSHVAGAGSKEFWLISRSKTGTLAFNRTFRVNVPSTYKPGVPMGMILSYHGRLKNASEQELLSQFSNELYNPDWISVYPQGHNDNWEGPTYHDKRVSDVRFTVDLLEHMRNNYCIDNSRIYANGKSNGGGFVGTMACLPVGGNFAAFAPVSGAFYTNLDDSSPCDPARSGLPILEFHGFNDTKIPYEGGQGAGGPTPPIPAWLDRWAKRNGCEEHPPGYVPDINGTLNPWTNNYTYVYHSSWNCNDQPLVQGYNISDLGHVWPSKDWNDDNRKSHPTVIEATQIIMDFFRSHTKPT